MTSRRRGVVLAIVTLVLAIVTSLLLTGYVSGLEREVGEKIRVVAAAKDIPSRTLIVQEVVTVVEMPKRYFGTSYVQDPLDVIGRKVALVDVKKGDIIKTTEVEAQAGLKPNMRAVSVAVDHVTSVASSVRPGNRVDILVSYSEGNVNRTVILLQDVEVLAVTGSGLKSEPLSLGSFLPSGQPIKDTAVTLALSLEDAARLTYMANFAKEVRLVLRRMDETSPAGVQPITTESFR